MDSTKILDRLYIGSCPRTNEDIEVLHLTGILHWHCGMNLNEAYQYVRSRRSCSPTLDASAMPERPKSIRQDSQKEG